MFSSWLEYSLEKDAAFCLYCFLFYNPGGNFRGGGGHDAFIVGGFSKWKKVRDGERCAFLNHVGNDPNSSHKINERAYEDLMKQSQHIEHLLHKKTTQQVLDNHLQLQASIDVVKWLSTQGCAFRGHDKSSDSSNRGNFIELLKLLSFYNKNVKLFMENAPQNALYTSSEIQKEILQVLVDKVRESIRQEIGDAKFYIIVDETRDESKREQMALVLRFVDKKGFLRECFFGVVRVIDTSAKTLKNAIVLLLSHYDLNIQNIRGQGYDGASNMRGEFNGLQALISKECPYAYYIHCLAHRLQLTLVASSKEVIPVYNFLSSLTCIVNVVVASSKRNDELKSICASAIACLIENDELETGSGLN